MSLDHCKKRKTSSKLINFLDETCTAIKESGHTIDEVVVVCNEDMDIVYSWEEFAAMADRRYIPSMAGESKVAIDLVILFKSGGKLQREYERGHFSERDFLVEKWVYFFPSKNRTENPRAPRLFGRNQSVESLAGSGELS